MGKRVIYFFILLLSCQNVKKPLNSVLNSTEIIYTDSFSPENYEYPLTRKFIPAEDSDIGKFINPESINQIHRDVYILVNNFFTSLQTGQIVSKFFTDNCYNNFFLRYRGTKIVNYNNFRISEPDESQTEYWVQIKVFTTSKKIIGKIQIINNDGTYLINDFSNELFDELMK